MLMEPRSQPGPEQPQRGPLIRINANTLTISVVALAGVGLSTDFRAFKGLGVKPFVVGLGAALVVGVVSFVAISLLGSFVTL